MVLQHFSDDGARVLSWASLIEPGTVAQAERASRMPFVFPHLALMPDAHLGKGATVGSVIPTQGAIMPAAVGVDIGCGMAAVRTDLARTDLPADLAPLRAAIEAAIPLSAGNYNRAVEYHHTRQLVAELESAAKIADFDPAVYGPWQLQLGSLGSGNHFIEVSTDQDGRVWLFLHSGSRGVGNKIAQRHIKVAQALAKKWWIPLADPDLAYLVEGTDQFWEYIRELRWAQQFAALNRDEMMWRLTQCVQRAVAPVDVDLTVNCHHNYTVQERHYGRDVWLSRKGAINAHEGVWGLIPGSMGAASYVVVGKGLREAFCSAPHGAGRTYSRSRARATFGLEDLRTRMAGIEWRESAAFLDEHPDAYKDIDLVMEDARDLVEVRYALRQLLNVKGD